MQERSNNYQAIRTIEEIGGQGLVPTIAPIDMLEKVVKQVELLKKKLALDEEVIYYGEDGKPCPREQAVAMYVPRKPLRTYMMAFNLSNEIIGEDRFEAEDAEGKYYVWRYKVRVSMANGRFVEQIGACSSRDPFFSKKYGQRVEPDEANIMEKAMTSALNRGISDILGGTIPTEEDIRLRHAEYLLKKKAGMEKKTKSTSPKKAKSSAEKAEPKPAAPATKEREDVLINLMLDPVFTDEERTKVCEWIDKGQTEESVEKEIQRVKNEIKDRRKVLNAEKKQTSFV